ncbi:MAG: hypothetical protein ACR2JF_17935 [Iamia sp.]
MAPPDRSGADDAATRAPSRPGPPPPPEGDERRTFLLAGAAFLGILVVLIGVVVAFSGDAGDPQPSATTEACAEDDAACRAAQQETARPGIIPRPGEGQAPDQPGDRGGWEQWAVLGALVAGLSLIIAMVVRSGRRQRRTSPAPTRSP